MSKPKLCKGECVSAVRTVLDSAGIQYRTEKRKHQKFYIQWGNREHVYTVGTTTGSSNRALENTKAGIKRLLRNIGALDPKINRG